MAMFVYPHNVNSQGARELSRALGVNRVSHTGTKVFARTDTIINWGSTELPARTRAARIINKPVDVAKVTNKLTFFERMKDVRLTDGGNRITPIHFNSIDGARDCLRQKGGSIVCRTVLNGSGGVGIVIADSIEQLVNARLYVRYVNKKDEYRVHIMNGRVIDTQRKARRLDENDVDWRVRNHDNGFIFVREGVRAPACVPAVAMKCMEVLGMDFGAVDVIYNQQNNRAYVLEVNSAPGLEGQTVVNYAAAIRREYR